jgi:parallel beta-helix repeat protein
VTVTANVCRNKRRDDKPGTQGYGILESGKSDHNVITGNVARDNTAGAFVTVGAATVVNGNSATGDTR